MNEEQLKAFEAYCLELSGIEIGKRVDKSVQTITAWKKKFNWEKLKQDRQVSRDNAEQTAWELLNYNLSILARIARKQAELAEKNPDPSIKELQAMLTPRGDVDAVQKLHTTIKGKANTWGDCIRIAQEQLEYFQANHYEAAKVLAPLMDEWLNHKRKEL